jgi:hypothetical protein
MEFNKHTNFTMTAIEEEFSDQTSLVDIRKIFFNFGDPPPGLEQKTAIRIEQEKQKIKNIAPDAAFYRFGELTPAGNPQKLEDITNDDPIYELN